MHACPATGVQVLVGVAVGSFFGGALLTAAIAGGMAIAASWMVKKRLNNNCNKQKSQPRYNMYCTVCVILCLCSMLLYDISFKISPLSKSRSRYLLVTWIPFNLFQLSAPAVSQTLCLWTPRSTRPMA